VAQFSLLAWRGRGLDDLFIEHISILFQCQEHSVNSSVATFMQSSSSISLIATFLRFQMSPP
jgi:hypothetical protein